MNNPCNEYLLNISYLLFLNSMYRINSNFNGGKYMTVRFHVHIKPSATCSDLNQKASFYLIQHKLTKIPEQVMHEDVCQYD